MITQMIKKLYFVIAILVFALTYAQRIGIGSHSFDDSEILKIVCYPPKLGQGFKI